MFSSRNISRCTGFAQDQMYGALMPLREPLLFRYGSGFVPTSGSTTRVWGRAMLERRSSRCLTGFLENKKEINELVINGLGYERPAPPNSLSILTSLSQGKNILSALDVTTSLRYLFTHIINS